MDITAEYISEQLLVSALKQGSHEAFIIIFKRYYTELVLYTGAFLKEKNDCEDVVQEVFARLWKRRSELNIRTSLKSFLYKLVKDKCIDQLRYHKVRLEYSSNGHFELLAMTPEDYMEYNELSAALDKALELLPDEQREVLLMSRHELLKNKEIAQKLNISIRTVEYRLSKALRFIHDHLKIFLPSILLILSVWL